MPQKFPRTPEEEELRKATKARNAAIESLHPNARIAYWNQIAKGHRKTAGEILLRYATVSDEDRRLIHAWYIGNQTD